ncbi:MAG: chemotaxis protein [Desulfuromonadaceae bacterium]|nr:chemotaxis protein [Desulfuromonas sp.]MDY0184881.1 chemotaxis protein [Desulfuromonadaceae bacterium]
MALNKKTQGILLEAGTNEFEILEYYLYGQSFGINVHKLREIIPYNSDELTRIPETHPSVMGTLLLRGSTISLINLAAHLGKNIALNQGDEAGSSDAFLANNRPVVLVCEFNDDVVAFLVDGVDQIHRLSWAVVKPMDQFFETYHPRFTGSVTIAQRDILIVDMEHITNEVFGDGGHYSASGTSEDLQPDRASRRAEAKLFFAEDSTIIRQGILSVLRKAGYVKVEGFGNGKQCLDALLRAKAENDLPMLVVSDIEMPELDGLSLCKQIKDDPIMKDISVVIYSSLINDNTSHKCEEVGADAYTSKPDVNKVVHLVDRFCLNDGVETQR